MGRWPRSNAAGPWIARETTHKSDAAAREPRRADAVSRFGSVSDPRFRASPRASLRGSVGCPVRRPPVKAEPDRSPYEPSVRPGPRPGSRVGRRVPSLPNGQPRDFRHRGCIRSINMSEPACPARCLSRISRGRVAGVSRAVRSEPRAAAPPTRLPLPIAACQPHPVAKPRGPPRPRHRTQTRTFMNVEFELDARRFRTVSRQSESVVPRFTVPRPARHRHPRLRRPPRARVPRPARALPAFAVVPASRRRPRSPGCVV